MDRVLLIGFCLMAAVLVPMGQKALAQSLAQKPELIVQAGHPKGIYSVEFSPNGRTLATGGGGNTVKTWDVVSGRELRTLGWHPSGVEAFSFSHDGKTLANDDSGGNVRIWDVVSGELLHALHGESDSLESFFFSPDDKLLAATSSGSVTLWEVSSGKELKTFSEVESAPDDVYSVFFSRNGRILAAGHADEMVKIWNLRSGKEVRSFKWLDEKWSTEPFDPTVRFSPDGKVLAAADYGLVKLWDVRSGKELHTLRGDSGTVSEIKFSPDGKTMATGEHEDKIRLWDVRSGKELRTILGHGDQTDTMEFSPDGKTLVNCVGDAVKQWDLATGELLRTFKGYANDLKSFVFSSDGRMMIINSGPNLELWDFITGALMRTLKSSAADGYFVSYALGPEHKTVVSIDSTGTISLWDVSRGQELRTFKVSKPSELKGSDYKISFDGQTILLRSESAKTVQLWDASTGVQLLSLEGRGLAFSPDNKTFAIVGDDLSLKLWDAGSWKEVRTFKGPVREKHSLSLFFTKDGKTLGCTSSPDTNNTQIAAQFWDVDLGQDLSSFQMQTLSFSLTRDGRTLAGVSDRQTVKLWGVKTGELLNTVKIAGQPDRIDEVEFSPSGESLIVTSSNSTRLGYTVSLWDVKTGQELRILNQVDRDDSIIGSYKASICFSPDGKTLASTDTDKRVSLWDAATGKLIRSFEKSPDNSSDSTDWVSNGMGGYIFFSPDGKTLLSDNVREHKIRLWDVNTGRALPTLNGVDADEDGSFLRIRSSISLNPDSRTAASKGPEGTIKLWQLSTGAELASLISLEDGNWAVVSPEGFFDGTPASWDKMIWRAQQNTFDFTPVESYFNDFFYPGLLADIFTGKLPQAKRDLGKFDRRQPRLKLSVKDIQSISTTRNIQVSVEVTEAPAGAQDVRLFRNGSLVNVWHGDVLRGQSRAALEATIPVVAGENKLTAYAFNHDNIKSSDAMLVVTGADSLNRKGTLHILAVGVSKYANREYNLNYTTDDATSFASQLKLEQEKLAKYQMVEIKTLEGLKSRAADADHNGEVTLREWFDYASVRVPKLREEVLQTKSLEEVTPKMKAARSQKSQTPRVFYRREAEAQPLIVAKP